MTSMPPLASAILIGFGSVVAAFGFGLLLTVLTISPRAKQTLILGGREWHLRASAMLVLLAGGLCLGVAFVSGPPPPSAERSATAERPGSPDHDRARAVIGGPVAMDPPARPQPETSQDFPPEGPLNLTGEWMITNTIVETSYHPYRDLRLGFRLVVQHDGSGFAGTGEKYLENGRKISVAARTPIHIQGRVAAGSVIEATFQEEGHARNTQGRFRLTMQDRQHLTGTFVSTAANARGASQWIRASAHQGAPASMRGPTSRAGHVSPPPPEQGAPPVIALAAPGQGQQVTTAQVQVRGTATGAPGIVRVDVQVNGEPRIQRAASGQATVAFAEPIALRAGPNDIVVTAFDQQHRAARHRVTVTRVEERPQAPAPADAPREPVPAGRSTARQHRPSLQLEMSQIEVRALLGEPVRVEATPAFVFWHYGPEAYVVFEQGTGRVYGWVGISS
jgi:hypothetical protein